MACEVNNKELIVSVQNFWYNPRTLYIYNTYIWAIPRKVTYTLHKKSQLIRQPIKEGE